jgi:pentatricopeptide repeat protein
MAFNYYLEFAYTAISGAYAELFAFALAIIAHQVFFGNNVRMSAQSKKKVAPPVPASPGSQKSMEIGKLKLIAEAGSAESALAMFNSLPEKSTGHYNVVLDGLVRCGKTEAANKVMADAKACRKADVGTFNTFMKIHLQANELQKARDFITEMRSSGVEPNTTTYNEILSAAVRDGCKKIIQELLVEMRSNCLRPNRVTCSILLKSANQVSDKAYVEKVLAMIDDIDGGMDDVLLGSVIDACIRTGQHNVLNRILRKLTKSGQILVETSHGYGSLIRAYGYLQDIASAWETWKELRTRRVELTSVVVGCMVEAIVQNGDPEGAYDLVRELCEDPSTRHLLNVVVYCSVLKGFSHQKRFERTWAVYEDMMAQQMKPTVITFNALIDSCARCKEMVRIPELLESMKKQGVEPNVITYSTVVKGYCEEGEMDKALALLDEMKGNPQLKPDEHTYNTVINGCARCGLCEKGYRILDEMVAAGVRPSNFTLSVLVKLAGRGRQIEKAFELCETFVRKYGVSLNMHVYNNLLQVCVSHKTLQRAIGVFQQMLQKRVKPDARTYKLLLQACTEADQLREAAGFLRAACGLDAVHPCLTDLPRCMFCLQGGLPQDIVRDFLQTIAKGARGQPWTQDLVKDLDAKGCFKLDARLREQLRL